MPFYFADMPVADTRIEAYCLTPKALIQGFNQGMSIIIADVTGAIVPHPAIANRDQIAAKGDLTSIDGDTHAGSLDGAPAFIVDPRIISQYGHASAGAGGLHPLRHSLHQAECALICHSVKVRCTRQFQAGFPAMFGERPAGGTIYYHNAVFHNR
jgi:hypothetical protein